MSGMDYVDRLRSMGLYSINGTLLRIDLLILWKSFNSDVVLGLESFPEMAGDVGSRGDRFKLFSPVCRSKVRRRSLVIRIVSMWSSLASMVVEAGSVECFKRSLDVVLGSKLLDTF